MEALEVLGEVGQLVKEIKRSLQVDFEAFRRKKGLEVQKAMGCGASAYPEGAYEKFKHDSEELWGGLVRCLFKNNAKMTRIDQS